jgi:hypothetical protein
LDQRAKDLIEQGDALFTKRRPLMSVCQSIVDNFYPEREGFTASRALGDEFADHLMTSYPVYVRRELGNMISAMLRPAGREWAHITTDDEERQSNGDKRWLQYATGVQRRAMYDPIAQMVAATKQGDHDYVSFGQCVLTTELNQHANALLHRAWHFKDVAWVDGYNGKPEIIHHQWKLSYRTVAKLFPGKLHKNCRQKYEKSPDDDLPGRRIIVPSEDYEAPTKDADKMKGKPKRWRQPFVSIWIDDENKHVIDEAGVFVQPYIIPRWHKPSNSQYAYSPCTFVALPEARTMQAMTLTLLDAGEMGTNPPIVAKRGLFRDDFNRYPGGLTYADLEGDERLSDAMEFLTSDKSGIPLGMEMREDQKQILSDLFFISKINLPPPDHEMTAYETSLRNQEFIRNTLPLFEPIEDYNAELCEKDFEILFRGNAFGPLEDIPRSLLGKKIRFRFESPLNDAVEREKASRFQEMLGLIEQTAAMNPSASAVADIVTGLRDSLNSIQVPAKWINSEEITQKIIADQAALQAEQTAIQMDQQTSVADQQRAVADQEMVAASEA